MIKGDIDVWNANLNFTVLLSALESNRALSHWTILPGLYQLCLGIASPCTVYDCIWLLCK